MEQDDIQVIIDRAVNIATRCAMNGKPLARVYWIPPHSVGDDWRGNFAIEPYEMDSAGNTPPWEK